jgi:ribosomal protein S20
MANTISAAKNARKAEKRHLTRVAVKSELKTLRKKTLELAAESKDPKTIMESLRHTTMRFDQAGSNKYIHHRTASRKIGRLARRIHKLATAKAAA